MSEPIAATENLIGELPGYFGKTIHGQRVLGRDAHFLAEGLLRYIRFPREAPKQGRNALETVDMLAPETSEALASFSRLNSTLGRLLAAPESDAFGPVRPTTASIELATKTLFQFVQRGFGFPEALDVGTDHDGALRIVWENGPRFLELVLPYEHNAAAYFYYSHGDQYGLQRDLTLPALRERFKWLSGAR